MAKSILFSFLLASTLWIVEGGKNANAEERVLIVGGEQANPGDYPYFVDIGHGCGGTLIAPDIVLFAAHCKSPIDSQVSIGAYERGSIDHGAQDRFCDEVIMHPEFPTVWNDIALCKLNRPVQMTGTPLELNEDNSVPNLSDVDLRVIGLGMDGDGNYPDFVHHLTVPYLGQGSECNFEGGLSHPIEEQEFCAGYPEGGEGTCFGDSGGPIVKHIQRDGTSIDVLVGVVSWGSEICAAKNFPALYARPSLHIDWIKTTMCNDLQSVALFCNNLVPSKVAGCPNEDEEELLIQVTTDARAIETKWVLLDSIGQEIKRRSYLFDNYSNEHKVCVKSDELYVFKITDRAKDGMCSGQCGSYSLSTHGVELVAGDGVFEKNRYEPFFVEASSNQPSLQPSFAPSLLPSLEPSFQPSLVPSLAPSILPSAQPSVNCKDKKSFKTGKSKSCRKHVKGQHANERCIQKHKGDFVYEWCPESCGKAGIGKCDWLKETKLEIVPMTEIQV